MTNARERQVEDLFDVALASPHEKRFELLEELCGSDAQLREEVLELLHAHEQSMTFLGDISLQNDRDALVEYAERFIGQSIRGYHIKRVLGIGGMGIVFEADQDHPSRSVALKVMHRGGMSRSAFKRFSSEAEILGRLRHPHVAHIYNTGIHDDGMGGMPFFVMEHIAGGVPITAYADRHGFSIAQRLKLFLKVCDAVQYGHQKGVVHRDLKPGNILVDERGEPKIIDFGVARATDSDLTLTTQQTDLGQLVGTVQYMSPEQCSGTAHDVDTRTDVYSLGVILYELLSGKLPYEASATTLLEATRTVSEATPRRLSLLDRRLHGDLETIVLTALEKDPAKRYQSPRALGEDIERHLNREPIRAHPPSPWLKATRWVARHPVATTTALCLMIVITSLAMTALSVWYIGFRPDRIELTEDGREARLLSRAGHVLHRWTSERENGIRGADLIDRPLKFGGGRIALVAFHTHHANPHPGQLCIFDVDECLEVPIWTATLDEDDLPEWLIARGFTVDEFWARPLGLFDIFPDIPGPQIAVSHEHRIYSQCALRIYDLDGTVLYQAWHDGPITNAHWLSDPKLLVLAGANGLVYWEERKISEEHAAVNTPHPLVVFAIHPELGVRTNCWINNAMEGMDSIKPIWYRCMHPPTASEHFRRPHLLPPMARFAPSRYVGVWFALRDDPRAGIGTVLDAYGHEVREGRVINDAYHRQPDTPDPDQFFIGDLPSIRSGAAMPWVRETFSLDQ